MLLCSATLQLQRRNHAPKTEAIDFLVMTSSVPSRVPTRLIVRPSTVVSTSAMTNDKMPSSKASPVEMMVAVIRAVIDAFVRRRYPNITVASTE
jgi:hypothetical protein